MKKLLISGAQLRPDGYELGQGKYYGAARLLTLDLSDGTFSLTLEMREGNEHYPEEYPNLQYTAASRHEDILWLPTDTEVYKYRLPDMTCLACYSYPCFQNVHSVHQFGDEVYVTSTGLDNIVVLDAESGELLRIINSEGKDPWHRFDAEKDYRLVHTTKPHDSHPNFVFELDGSKWITRCTQEDAVNLDDVSQSLNISGGDVISVHDGLWWGQKLVFTRVDGFLVTFDRENNMAREQIDIFAHSRNRPNGWCRGLHIDGDMFYIGYSKLRKTRLKEKLKYLSQGNFKYSTGNNSLVVAYNMRERKVEKVHQVPDGLIDAIYGIVPL